MEALGRGQAEERSVTSALDMFTLRYLSSDVRRQNCATSNGEAHERTQRSVVLILTKDDRQQALAWDYCTSGLKIIKKMEICPRCNGWVGLQRGVCLRNGDRTMVLKWQWKVKLCWPLLYLMNQGICLEVTSAIKMLDLISQRFQFDYAIN